MPIAYYGIRHHGPGCARALEAALAAQQPDIVLLEGPPEADGLIALAAEEAMQPPVALLVYPVVAPRHGVFYPFAEFSPEWRAIRGYLGRDLDAGELDEVRALLTTSGSRRFVEELADEQLAAARAGVEAVGISLDLLDGATTRPPSLADGSEVAA